MGRVRSPKRRVRDDDFIVGYPRISSDYGRIVFLLAEALQGVSAQILSFKISWQAQYLVRLEGDFTCSAQWKWRFICHADHRWRSFYVAGTVFGEVGVTLLGRRIGNDVSYVTQINDDIHFVWQAQYLVRLAGDFPWQAQHFVTFWEIAGTRKVVFYNTKSSSKVPEAAGARWRFYRRISSNIPGLWPNRLSIGGRTSGIFRANLDLQDFVAGAVFGEVGGWLDWLRALEMTFHMSRRSSMTFILRGRRSIWWGWRVTLLGRRIGNDVSYVTQIIDDLHFAWQAQYLVMLEGDFTCSTHWKWRFICDADQWWHSFCVAGAVFGEVGGWLYLLHALEMTFQRSTGAVLCSTE